MILLSASSLVVLRVVVILYTPMIYIFGFSRKASVMHGKFVKDWRAPNEKRLSQIVGVLNRSKKILTKMTN